RYHHAASRVQRVGQVVAEPPVLPGCHASRAALADAALVDRPPGRVGRVLLRVAGALTEQGGFVDVDLALRGGVVRVGNGAVVLVPDDGCVARRARGDPRPQHGLAGVRDDVRLDDDLAGGRQHRVPDRVAATGRVVHPGE